MRNLQRVDPDFWEGKKVFITGHTGFKGSWLSFWLQSMGAEVTGYALRPPTNPNLYDLMRMGDLVTSHIGDIRDSASLSMAYRKAAPDIVFHLAAQPLVRDSYDNPAQTYEINAMGTVHLLETVRQAALGGIPPKAVVVVTTDKCYENQEWSRGYRETDRLGGTDPYSSSKACAELIAACYEKAFFGPHSPKLLQIPVASVRAGNAIGGGDWAKDRLIPDSIRQLSRGESIKIRYPQAIRPWQHVLEPLYGYLLVAQRLVEDGFSYAQAWNFGPDLGQTATVEQLVGKLCNLWGNPSAYTVEQTQQHVESRYLQLDSSKAMQLLGWKPRWELDKALAETVHWYQSLQLQKDVRELCRHQIHHYMEGE
ncbi:CDP-glucose 4,6-dehydratase [Paenibacillus hexagrammi]|uniref:CDP-glucose 4,6-dehydratase n=1 Tax=Paenibacillus hexagrammi TaxID=2908839 RepID=A0ABY3SNC6_9BACL|nr:CDP-glucose 4,6-dehydratase [Paenibacillus sp. YPD9-1]UJF35497.1 CDP-glucose 4,6-dehydratase [Paenibacillus sp. YPD9-1]